MDSDVMQGHASVAALLRRLTELVREVDSLKGEDRRAERLEASARVEKELQFIETRVAEGADTTASKQGLGLIALVRAALQTDRDNATLENWSDEGILKAHGLATYATQAYWDEAYADKKYGEAFDWYSAWDDPDSNGHSLASVLRPRLRPELQILMLGCGNSNMSAVMYAEGFHDITNVDISQPVIEQMQQLYSHLEGMTWHAMDARTMGFANATFDVAIEKGMFDALFAGTGQAVQTVLRETRRVLKPGGQLLSVSVGADRIKRLFMASGESASEDEAAPQPGLPPMDCQTLENLQYDPKKSENRQNFYVYACSNPS